MVILSLFCIAGEWREKEEEGKKQIILIHFILKDFFYIKIT